MVVGVQRALQRIAVHPPCWGCGGVDLAPAGERRADGSGDEARRRLVLSSRLIALAVSQKAWSPSPYVLSLLSLPAAEGPRAPDTESLPETSPELTLLMVPCLNAPPHHLTGGRRGEGPALPHSRGPRDACSVYARTPKPTSTSSSSS